MTGAEINEGAWVEVGAGNLQHLEIDYWHGCVAGQGFGRSYLLPNGIRRLLVRLRSLASMSFRSHSDSRQAVRFADWCECVRRFLA